MNLCLQQQHSLTDGAIDQQTVSLSTRCSVSFGTITVLECAQNPAELAEAETITNTTTASDCIYMYESLAGLAKTHTVLSVSD